MSTPDDRPTVPPLGTADGANPPPPDSGNRFGGYELLEEVSRGESSVLYRARQVALDRIVALKVFEPSSRPAALRGYRLQGEDGPATPHVSHLDHPGIVRVFEAGSHEGRGYVAMALVEGESLAARLRRGPLPARAAAQLLRRLCEALHHAHARGVLHGALTPASVLLGPDDTPRLIGFIRAGAPGEDAASYLAPETRVEPATDVYGLGAILHAALTGSPPFQAATIEETRRRVREDEPLSPRRLNPRVPRGLETICRRCLRKRPGARYSSVVPLLRDLLRFLSGQAVRPEETAGWAEGGTWPRWQPRVVAWIGVVLLAVVAPGLWQVGRAIKTREAAWAAVSRPDATAREYREALAVFDRAAALRPFDPQPRRGALLARYRLGRFDEVQVAEPALHDPVARLVRALAAFRLGEVGAARGLGLRPSPEGLQERFAGAEAGLVAEAAGLAGDIEVLTRHLSHVEPAERVAAAEMLGECGQRAAAAIPALALRAEDEAPEVRKAAREALDRIERR
jgi:hypothetical protein